MSVQEMLQGVAERLASATKVNAVFGESRQIGQKTIIPIASICMGFGAGGGEAKEIEEGESEHSEGGGGGGGGHAKPLAVLEITDEETKIIPVLDMTKIIVCGMFLTGSIVCMLTCCRSKR